MLKGYIEVEKSITYIIKGNGIVGNINENNDIIGHINETASVIGRVGKGGNITGKIDKPSHQASAGDHQFVVVDLVKMYEQIISVDNVNAIVPFTAQSSQVLNKLIEMYAVPTGITISQVTANNISFTALKTQNLNKNINIYAVPTTITVSQVTVTVNEEES